MGCLTAKKCKRRRKSMRSCVKTPDTVYQSTVLYLFHRVQPCWTLNSRKISLGSSDLGTTARAKGTRERAFHAATLTKHRSLRGHNLRWCVCLRRRLLRDVLSLSLLKIKGCWLQLLLRRCRWLLLAADHIATNNAQNEGADQQYAANH